MLAGVIAVIPSCEGFDRVGGCCVVLSCLARSALSSNGVVSRGIIITLPSQILKSSAVSLLLYFLAYSLGVWDCWHCGEVGVLCLKRGTGMARRMWGGCMIGDSTGRI